MRTRALMLAVLTAGSGCAFMNPNNMPLLTSLSGSLDDEEHSVLATTAVLVLGTPAAVVDILLVHPVCVIDDAWRDTVYVVADMWKNPHGGIMTQAFMFLPKVVATPVVGVGNFALSWTTRATFDMREIPPLESEPEAAPEQPVPAAVAEHPSSEPAPGSATSEPPRSSDSPSG